MRRSVRDVAVTAGELRRYLLTVDFYGHDAITRYFVGDSPTEARRRAALNFPGSPIRHVYDDEGRVVSESATPDDVAWWRPNLYFPRGST